MTSKAEYWNANQWRLDAAEKQQEFYTHLGDRAWDEIPAQEPEIIHDKISGSLYSRPYSKCSTKEQITVSNTTNKVLELSGSSKCIRLGYVYVCFLTKENRVDGILPLIRTSDCLEEKIYFVEFETNRVYTGWSNYEKNNTLPECWICSPADGFYTERAGKVAVSYSESPACNKTLKTLDTVACVSSVMSTVVLGVSTVMFPPLMVVEGPAMATLLASGSYSVGRGVAQLCDRSKHQQSIGLLDEGALPIWLNMIANIGGTALGGAAALSSAVSLGGPKLAAAILRYACIGVNSFGVMLCIVNLVLKFKDGSVTWEDVDQFIFLALFIGNIAITRAMANRVVEAVAEEPHRLKNVFNMVKNTAYKSAKILVKDVPCAVVLELLTGPMIVMILRQIHMPHTATVVNNLRSSVTRLIRGRMSPIAFGANVFSFLYPFFDKFRAEVSVAVQTMQKMLNVPFNYVVINGKQMFKYSSRIRVAEIMDRIRQPIDNLDVTDPNIEEDATKAMLKFATKMAEFADCQTDRNFANLCAFLAEKVQKEYDNTSIVAVSEIGHAITDENKGRLFKDVIAIMEKSSKICKLVEEYRSMQRMTAEARAIFDQPMYQSAEMIMHYFETSLDFRIFNQFIYDAACELLNTDSLFENATLELQGSLFVIRYEKRVLFFYFQVYEKEKKVEGMAVLSGDDF